MATSPLFGWEEPDDTDLVKDGAAAIRTLGNAIDTSMGDLLGGTTGQILSKNSNTNMDFTWVTNDVGDITAVTAGTGISGGGTSGAVTITNSMATEIAAKGDLIVGTGSQTFDNLTAGSNNFFLGADSSTATGLKWLGSSISYTPTWTASGSNPSLGNGTLTGSYMQVGNLIAFTITLDIGSTTTGGSGAWRFALPFALNYNRQSLICQAKGLDIGVRWYTNFVGDTADPNLSSSIQILNPDSTDGDYITGTYPMTWGNGDGLYIQGLYRIGGL